MRSTAAVLCALVALLGIGLYLSLTGPGSASDGRTTIRMICALPSDVLPTLRELLKEFEEQNPDIRVKVELGVDYTKYQIMLVGGVAPDVMHFSGKRVLSFARRNALLNLLPYVEQDQDYHEEDFYPVAWEGAQRTEDSLYYIPWEGSATVLYYNKDLFDAAGASYPSDDWTWNGLLEACKKLTHDVDGDGRPDQAAISLTLSICHTGIPWVWQNGGAIFDPGRTRCLVNRPEAIEAIRFFMDFERKHKVTVTSLAGGEGRNRNELFLSGKIAMVPYIAYNISSFSKARKLNWDVALYPKGPKGRAARYTSSGWVIPRQCRHKEQAWRLVRFLTSPKPMMKLALAGDFVPTRRSLAESEEFNRAETPWDERVLVRAIRGSRPLPGIDRFEEFAAIWKDELDKVVYSNTSVQDAMQRITDRVNEMLKP